MNETGCFIPDYEFRYLCDRSTLKMRLEYVKYVALFIRSIKVLFSFFYISLFHTLLITKLERTVLKI